MILNREVLEAWRAKEGRLWNWVANRVGVTPETFSHQLAGRAGVSLTVAWKLREITGISLDVLVIARPASA